MSSKGLIDQARKDRAAAEAAGDLGLVVFIDGFIAGAIEMQRERDEHDHTLYLWEHPEDDHGTD